MAFVMFTFDVDTMFDILAIKKNCKIEKKFDQACAIKLFDIGACIIQDLCLQDSVFVTVSQTVKFARVFWGVPLQDFTLRLDSTCLTCKN